jgi:Bacterial membrane protein YfhO.
MPFLIMSMIGVDNYFKNNKKTLLIISTFLIIMTSYFFSVPSILVLVIYGVYKYLENNKKINFSNFIKDGLRYIGTLLVPVLMASIILLPTLYVLITGRSDTNFSINYLEILRPSLSISRLLYSAYTSGMTSFFIFVLMNHFFNQKKEKIFISLTIILILIFPIFSFILNGGMYIDTKVFIPFVPLFSLMSASTINDIFKKDNNFSKAIIGTLIIGIIMAITNIRSNLVLLFMIDIIFVIVAIKMFLKNKYILYAILVVPSITLLIVNVYTDQLYPIKKMELLESSAYDNLIDKALVTEDNIYRLISDNNTLQNINRVYNINHYSSTIYSSTSNKLYKDFYYEHSGAEVNQRSYGKLSSSKNIFYNMFMGNKYHISNRKSMIGYSPLYTAEGNTIYANKHVFPIIYATGNMISEKEINNLEFPYNMDALLRYAIIDSSSTEHYVTSMQEIYPHFNIVKEENISKKIANNEHIIISRGGSIKMETSDLADNEILIIKFTLNNNPSCEEEDLSITINGIKNVLTCSDWKYHNGNNEFKYVISSNRKIKGLNIKFSEGIFHISNIRTYKANYDDLIELRKNIDEMHFDKKKTTGSIIEGDIYVRKGGFLNTTIPYDKGFKLYIDGKKTEYVKTNYGFIGAPISIGMHKIRLEYRTPLLREGMFISAIGFVMMFNIIYMDINKNKKKTKKRVA